MIEDVIGEIVMERLKTICDEATSDQFRSRLDISAVVRAYIVKRYSERFPEDYNLWCETSGEEPVAVVEPS